MVEELLHYSICKQLKRAVIVLETRLIEQLVSLTRVGKQVKLGNVMGVSFDSGWIYLYYSRLCYAKITGESDGAQRRGGWMYRRGRT